MPTCAPHRAARTRVSGSRVEAGRDQGVRRTVEAEDCGEDDELDEQPVRADLGVYARVCVARDAQRLEPEHAGAGEGRHQRLQQHLLHCVFLIYNQNYDLTYLLLMDLM